MGHLYQIACDCGFEKSGLQEGAGFSRVGYSIYQCKKCNTIDSMCDDNKEKRCKECRSRKIVTIHPQDNVDLKCPKCGRKLMLDKMGMWD